MARRILAVIISAKSSKLRKLVKGSNSARYWFTPSSVEPNRRQEKAKRGRSTGTPRPVLSSVEYRKYRVLYAPTVWKTLAKLQLAT
jgi:hypothetical protein